MEANRDYILLLYVIIAAFFFIHSDARRSSMGLIKDSKQKMNSIIKSPKKLKVVKHTFIEEMLTNLNLAQPLDSTNTQPYGVNSPFTLPPYDSLSPIPLPQFTPPNCGYPQSPTTTTNPSPPQNPVDGHPSPPEFSSSSPFSPITVPSPFVYIPSPPDTNSNPSPCVYVPSPIVINPPYYEPSPPSFNPSPPTYVNPSPIGFNPSPPSYIVPSPIGFNPSPPTFSVPSPIGFNPSPPSFNVPSPIGFNPSPPTFSVPSPIGFNPSPPSFSVPSPIGFKPSPRVFLPPIVYPPPTSYPSPKSGPGIALWCVAKASVPDPIIQEAMNYACGSGADCDSILPSGTCFEPNTLFAHASYAFNSYWQRTKVAGGTCEFGGTAILVTVDPSYNGCHFMYD